ncbi:hypothetical protein [Thalassorhabdomicrobium marinisediminis]|uniref:hypothetical protein n=1 Tax=Thalassorhabdomicrobium marinisediminis TaxID=2170577 RepID=UPI001304F3C1|nr:hypothetical protein [Thalassorhabdomicrobium marinisediminis]
MTAHAKFGFSPAKVPIVLRFEGLHPRDLGRFDMRDRPNVGDLSHFDREASRLNEKLFGRLESAVVR